MNKKKNNENLVKNSNQPQIEEFYKKMNEKKVFNLKDVLKYDWIKDVESNEMKYNLITNNGKNVIWEFGDSEEPTDELINSGRVNDKIEELDITGDESKVQFEEFTDEVIEEFREELESLITQKRIQSFNEIDMNNISNYYVGEKGILICDGYYDYHKKVLTDFINTVELILKGYQNE